MAEEIMINLYPNEKETMINRMGGLNGSKTVTGTGAVTAINFSQIYVREATVIGTLTGTDLVTGATSNLLTTLGISAVSLLAGELHVAPYGTKISAITLTSGSVILY